MSAGPDRARPPTPGPMGDVRLPEFRRFRLGNGLRVWFAEERSLPEVSLRLVAECGALADPAGGEGLAELTGRLLTEGAGDRSAYEMNRWLDRIGAGFEVSVGYDAFAVSLHLVADVLGEALDFLSEAVRRPSFAVEEVERVRDERLDEIERELDRAEVVADHTLIGAVYGDHRYGVPSAGTRRSVESVRPDGVRSFHEESVGPAGSVLLVCGDVGEAELRDALEARFGSWESGSRRPEVPPAPDRAREAGRVLLVDRPGSAQAELRVGAVGASHGAPDHYPLLVANAVLGGLFNSRINMNLREEKGWTYGARTRFEFRRGRGPFVAAAAVETPAAAAALEEILAELRGLRDRPPTGTELELARNALSLSLPRKFETAGQVTRRASALVIYDLPDDHWERYRERVEAVDRAGVEEAVRRRLDPDEMVLVAVGDASELRPRLEDAFGDVEVRTP